eukprot:COSAG01_NODE_54436_length_332_cov_0.630901_1_plen_44_part_10
MSSASSPESKPPPGGRGGEAGRETELAMLDRPIDLWLPVVQGSP